MGRSGLGGMLMERMDREGARYELIGGEGRRVEKTQCNALRSMEMIKHKAKHSKTIRSECVTAFLATVQIPYDGLSYGKCQINWKF